jgi:hypothetical protein
MKEKAMGDSLTIGDSNYASDQTTLRSSATGSEGLAIIMTGPDAGGAAFRAMFNIGTSPGQV